MYTSTSLISLLVATACYTTVAFTPTSHAVLRPNQAMVRTQTNLNALAVDSEDEAMMIMMAARCAHSDTCSIDDAEDYLNQMLNLKSNCADGTLNSPEVCEDVIFSSEVIASLREKIQREAQLSNKTGQFSIGLNPIFLGVLALYLSGGLISMAHNNPDSFTIQEWMYALKGGYLDEMFGQFLKYGGLSPVEDYVNIDGSNIVAISAQEWWWSIRDGYVGSMVSEMQHHGGLLTLADDTIGTDDSIITTPLTSQEWQYALKDGYFPNMLAHYVRNGGL